MEIYTQREDVASPWWLVLLEGIFAAVFGFFVLMAPGATLFILVQFFGFYLLIAGILRIVSIFTESSMWGLKLLVGIVGILAGVLVIDHPHRATRDRRLRHRFSGHIAGGRRPDPSLSRRRLGHRCPERLGDRLRHHRAVKSPDRRGGYAVRFGRGHAGRRHRRHSSVLSHALEPC
jgi:hypothetical protein